MTQRRVPCLESFAKAIGWTVLPPRPGREEDARLSDRGKSSIVVPSREASLSWEFEFVGRIAQELDAVGALKLMSLSRVFEGWNEDGWKAVVLASDGFEHAAEAHVPGDAVMLAVTKAAKS